MAGAYSSAYSSAFDTGGGATTLTGTLFVKAPTFFTGALSAPPQALTGTLFVKNPVFYVGNLGAIVVPMPATAEGLTSIRVEVWSLPDDPDGFRLLCEPPFIAGTGFQDRFDVHGGGQLIVPADYEHRDLIVRSDPADIESSHSSLVRGLEWWDDAWHVVWEFYADEGEEQLTDAGQRVFRVTGLDIRSAPDDGIVYPRTATNPHWQWGAPSWLENPGFEDTPSSSAAFQLSIDATAGTFTITIGADTTAAIPFNAGAADIAIAVEALPLIVDVVVTGVGTATNPFILEFLDPANADIGTVSTNSAGLTGLASVQIITVGGASIVTPWTRSFNPSTGLYHGTYNSFGASTEQAHTGTYSLKIDGELGAWAGSHPGGQQIHSAEEGQAWGEAFVYPETSGRYRFGIRTIDDTWLGQVEADLTADQWNTMVIPSVDIPAYAAQVITRVAYIGEGPAVFFVDDVTVAPGFPATTWGDILSTLMNAAFTRGTLPWLELGFDAALDSDGQPWDNDEFAFQADALMRLGTHVIGDGEAAGYEHDVVPLEPPGATTHQLLAFNPRGRGDRSLQAAVVGAFETGRLAFRRMPYTHLLLELYDGSHVEATDPRLAGFPRRERGVRVEQANDVATALQIAVAIFDKEIANLLATQVTFYGGAVLPYRDFDLGWIVPHTLRRVLKHDRRVQVIASSYTGQGWRFVVTAAGVEAEES